MSHVSKRVVLHFPGFEPLDAEAHRARYERSAAQSAATWNYIVRTGPLEAGTSGPFFMVESRGPDWRTESRLHILDHDDLIAGLNGKPLLLRIAAGYASAARVMFYGGLQSYFKNAWRFGLFFLFPFLLMALGLAVTVLVGAIPILFDLSAWHFVWSVPAALAFFLKLFLPAAERLHTLHLFADWEMAIAMANLTDTAVLARLDACIVHTRDALSEDADEYLITSHSMGSALATYVVGALIEREPHLLVNKRIVFATLGSGLLQCALLRPAIDLREKIGRVARFPHITWLDVQCLTDAIHFYKVAAVAATGHADAPQAKIVRIRFKNMLTEARYRKIRRQLLRVHRQYVLGSDRRSMYDFSLMTAGPLPAATFAAYSPDNLPPLSADGAIGADNRNP